MSNPSRTVDPSPAAAVAIAQEACAICAAPLTSLQAQTAVVCHRVTCRSALEAMPRFTRCAECGRPLAPHRRAIRVCERPACHREAVFLRPMAAMRAAREALHASAARRKARALAARGIPAHERDSWLVSVVPSNPARASRIPARRVQAFAAHLQECLEDARARMAQSAPAPMSSPPQAPDSQEASPHAEAVSQLLQTACAICRGFCCRGGGTHAFQRSDRMRAYLTQHPDHTDETIVARYVSYIGTHTLTDGCVFQGETGCTLPRDLRADICNTFYCGGLSMLHGRYGEEDPVRAYIIVQRQRRFRDGHCVEIPVASSPPSTAGVAAASL